MTRKRFWGLRNAFCIRLNEWAKANGLPTSNGLSDKKMRPVSGKPLIDFGGTLGVRSYEEAWNLPAMRAVRKNIGMEVSE